MQNAIQNRDMHAKTTQVLISIITMTRDDPVLVFCSMVLRSVVGDGAGREGSGPRGRPVRVRRYHDRDYRRRLSMPERCIALRFSLRTVTWYDHEAVGYQTCRRPAWMMVLARKAKVPQPNEMSDPISHVYTINGLCLRIRPAASRVASHRHLDVPCMHYHYTTPSALIDLIPDPSSSLRDSCPIDLP